ncbi:MAG: D-Ala-D-Ala carboxypeptidase family metallohydrolase, partial [Candidatus Binataceae bacterium]
VRSGFLRMGPIMRDVRLSAHYMVNEFIVSQEATRNGIDNNPSSRIIDNLRWTAENLELIWLTLAKPVLIVSSGGYRSSLLNSRIGGSKNSDHCFGLAADIIVPRYGSPYAVADAIGNSPGILFNELILEYDAWVHVSFPANRSEPQRRIYTRRSGRLMDGLVSLRTNQPNGDKGGLSAA